MTIATEAAKEFAGMLREIVTKWREANVISIDEIVCALAEEIVDLTKYRELGND